MYDQSRTKRSVWMKDWRVIELTFLWSPNISIEATPNLERNKALDERSNSELTLRCHRCSTRDNDKSCKKQGFGWEVGTWSNLLFGRCRCSNWDKHLYKDNQGIEWKIEVIKLTFRWSSIFQWRHQSIERETNDWIKHWMMIELTF